MRIVSQRRRAESRLAASLPPSSPRHVILSRDEVRKSGRACTHVHAYVHLEFMLLRLPPVLPAAIDRAEETMTGAIRPYKRARGRGRVVPWNISPQHPTRSPRFRASPLRESREPDGPAAPRESASLRALSLARMTTAGSGKGRGKAREASKVAIDPQLSDNLAAARATRASLLRSLSLSLWRERVRTRRGNNAAHCRATML